MQTITNKLISQFKIITIFGSSSDYKGTFLFQEAEKLGYELAKLGYSIRTGGQDSGGGFMSAASIGAEKANKELESNKKVDIQGIILKGVWTDGPIPQCTQSYQSQNIGARTDDLCSGSSGFIVLPGGKGTLLELIYLLNGKELPQKNNQGEYLADYKEANIYVYGNEWKNILEDIVDKLQNFGINKDILNHFIFMNSADEIINHIKQNPI